MPIENSENQRELAAKQSGEVDISKQEWFQKLNPEQQKKVQDLFVNLSELQKRADILQSTKKITGNSAKSLELALGRNPGATVDPEAKPTLVLLERWRQEFEKASTEQNWVDQKITTLTSQIQIISGVVTEAENAPQKNEKLSISPEKLSKISNAEFLSTPADERLRYISKGNIESTDIASGKVKEVEFTFTFEGKLNQDLYMYTTAGQVLPDNVRTVSSWGVSYERAWINGEFYNPESQKRLIIKDNIQITIGKLWSEKEMQEMQLQNTEWYKKFIDGNPEYATEKYKPLIEMSLEKWIEPKMFIISAQRRVEEFGENTLKKNEIEDLATDIGRSLSGIKRITGNYDIGTSIKILRKVNPTTWKDGLEKYGFKKEEIDDYDKKNPDTTRYNLDGINDFTPAEYSAEVEYSESGTTLCSRTARNNLTKMWIENPPTGGSARAAFDSYGKSAMPFPPEWANGAKVADLYLDATPKNAQYGHRVAAFEKNGKWFILDPYYKLPDIGTTRQPIPAETYISIMTNQFHKKIWWAHYYTETKKA